MAGADPARLDQRLGGGLNDRDDPALSYDPRSWGGRSTQPVAAVAPARPGDVGGSRPTPPRPSPPRPSLLRSPLAAALAIALCGAAAAYLSRDGAGPVAGVPPPAAPAATTPDERIDSRVLNLPTAGRIAGTLRTFGVAAGEADAAAALAIQGLGARDADLRLDVTLGTRPAKTRLLTLLVTRADGSGVTVTGTADGTFAAKQIVGKLVRTFTFIRGELDGESFYSSAVAAGVSDVLVGEFANAFRYDFDMQREVSQGDVFEAGFAQQVNALGEPVGTPTLVYAALSTAAKSRALYRFQPPGTAEAEWYDSSGRSSRTALMRTPVEAARISSGFGMRGHPILGFVKMHRGTDFAAPTGTPIFAAGDSVVTFAGPKGANGNFARLHHDNGWDTLYLHMNRIMPGIVPGARVAQGTQIGEVGTTGRSTGPHLHYEVHIDGAAVDPLSIETGGRKSIGGAALAAFRKVRDAIDGRRAATY